MKVLCEIKAWGQNIVSNKHFFKYFLNNTFFYIYKDKK